MGQAREIEMLAGDNAAAERAARQGCEQLERLGDQAWLSTQACLLADALYALGRYEESEHWALRGLELAAATTSRRRSTASACDPGCLPARARPTAWPDPRSPR